MGKVGISDRSEIRLFSKLFLLMSGVILVVVFSLPAKATIIEVPYAWFYQFDGQCVLGCETNDSFGNPIASNGANFSLSAGTPIFGIPQQWMGFDLTDSSTFTFLEDGSFFGGLIGNESVAANNDFNPNGLIQFSDFTLNAPGSFGEASAPNLPVDELGNVRDGVYSANSFLAGPSNISYEFSSVSGFPTTFNVTYDFILDVEQNVPFSDRNTTFYTDDGAPFWQGVGTWTRDIADSVATRINDPVSVPEPTTIGLMGLGLFGLVGFRRKK